MQKANTEKERITDRERQRYIPYLRRVDNMASIAFTHTHISAQQQPQKKGLTCYTAPGVIFATSQEIKEHYRSDWHRYNLKRKVGGLPPIRKEAFARRLAAALRLQEEAKNKTKKTNHLKSGKDRSSSSTSSTPSNLSRNSSENTIIADVNAGDNESKNMDVEQNNNNNEEEEINLDELTLEELNEHANPKQSIFDDKVFETVEDNLEYMRKKFNFVVPDLQYVSDIDGLVKYCSAKVRLGRICLYCNKQFRSCAAVQQHSRDMFHCRLNVGNINNFFDEFYDYYQWPEGEQGMEVENEDGTPSMTKQATVNVLPSGEILVTGKDGERKLVGTRVFNRYYKQNIRPEDTRDSVQALRKEKLLLAYKMAGIDTKTSDEKALSTFVQKQKSNYSGAMLQMARRRDHDMRVQQRRVDKNKLKLFKNKTAKKYRGEGVGIHG